MKTTNINLRDCTRKADEGVWFAPAAIRYRPTMQIKMPNELNPLERIQCRYDAA